MATPAVSIAPAPVLAQMGTKIQQPQAAISQEVSGATTVMTDNAAMSTAQMTMAMYKRRITWTPELEERFSRVVIKHGIKSATPRLILNEMAVEGLTRENVASHLQKFRKRVIKAYGISRAELQDSHGVNFLKAGGQVAPQQAKAPKLDTPQTATVAVGQPAPVQRAPRPSIPEMTLVRSPLPRVTDPDVGHKLPMYLL
ncbi:Myb-like DNA-binding domain [Carpediemonas membranifera]|uniref:Myb-like DNA-binding domain n=1 Tax=Carpediemonas membranifera TaxID=201153 RepID=A0A8J6BV67_9EUKA|nr:Myb-like DNA-binding domain [Carpediemonas membranifera]|eukprot:KAG9391116.1 Myb-like DNA-binding domain [Carpediemonas membranifera]